MQGVQPDEKERRKREEGEKLTGTEEALTADFERADRRPEALVGADSEGHGDKRLVVDEADYNGLFFGTVWCSACHSVFWLFSSSWFLGGWSHSECPPATAY